MRVEKSKPNNQYRPIFRAVGLKYFHCDNSFHSQLTVNFTQEDKVSAERIFNVMAKPKNNVLSVDMSFFTDVSHCKRGIKKIRHLFIDCKDAIQNPNDFFFDYTDGEKRNKRAFKKLCRLMQKTIIGTESKIGPDKDDIAVLKKFFKVRK